MKLNLEIGKKYVVIHRDNDNKKVKAKRLYLGKANRLGIPCYVFTSRINKNVEFETDGESIRMRGDRLPKQELSIPEYDLIQVENA